MGLVVSTAAAAVADAGLSASGAVVPTLMKAENEEEDTIRLSVLVNTQQAATGSRIQSVSAAIDRHTVHHYHYHLLLFP